MPQIPNMNWMGNEPTGSAYDVYQYYLGGGNPNANQGGGGGGGGGGIMQAYQPTTGDANFNQNIRTAANYRKPDASYKGVGSIGLPGNINQAGPGRQFQYDATGKSYDDIGLYGGVTKETLGQKIKGNPLVQGLLSAAMPGFNAVKMGAQWLGNKLPVNQRAIMENQMLGSGFALDDIGRIARGSGAYDTAGNVMAGYNAAQLTEESFDDRIAKAKKHMSKKNKKKRVDALEAAKKAWQDAQTKKDAITEQKKQEKKQKQWQRNADARDPNQGNTVTGHGKSGMGRDPSDKMATGGMVKDLTKDPEYRGWKKMYETNPEVGSMHEKHPTFIKFYKQNERDQKKFGGLAGLLYG